MPQIQKFLPVDIKLFNDRTCGALDVALNVEAETYLLNDINHHLIGLLEWFYTTPVSNVMREIDGLIGKYKLTRKNEEGYLKLRNVYNATKDPVLLYLLTVHSNSNYMRFNQKGQFNVPFGKRTFHNKLRTRLLEWLGVLQTKNIEFTAEEFDADNEGFVFVDPHYYVTDSPYKQWWSEKHEIRLYSFLDTTEQFALTNMVWNKDIENPFLKSWMIKYNVYELDSNYQASNYQRKNGDSREVLVTNV